VKDKKIHTIEALILLINIVIGLKLALLFIHLVAPILGGVILPNAIILYGGGAVILFLINKVIKTKFLEV